MIEKEIRKFFNTVSVSDRIPDAWKESEKKSYLLPIIGGGFFVLALVIAVLKWMVFQEKDENDSIA